MFRGEWMVCHKCGREQRSYRDFESQWTAVVADGIRRDYCPVCWGIPDPAPKHCKEHGHTTEFSPSKKRPVCGKCGVHLAFYD
jgi:ribosomal protein S14